MSKSEVFKTVVDIFMDIFDSNNLSIDNDTNADDIDEWDSLTHINLICAIEREFGFKFTLGELTGLKDVGSLVNLILKKV
jgi:acyl carrier protein